MVPATPCFTVYHNPLSALPGKCEHLAEAEQPLAWLWAAGKEEGYSQLTDKRHGHPPRAQAELAAPAPLYRLLEATGLTWITEGVCTWVVWSQQPWPGASRETADVRDLQTHKLGGRDTEDLVLKVRMIYFLYREYVFYNI